MTARALPEFQPWPKIPRRNKPVIVTEKIDGTNGIIHVAEDGHIIAGSRSRWLIDGADNFGFAAWVKEHEEELRGLGVGYHYGEWYGQGIQRGYGLTERRFALFNVKRWDNPSRPACCEAVPVLGSGFEADGVVKRLVDELIANGSRAVPGFMKPEGVVVFHTAAGTLQKVLIEGDDKPKGLTEAA